jgi:hypothetical protein
VPKVCGILFDAATFPIAQANDSAEMAGVAATESHDERQRWTIRHILFPQVLEIVWRYLGWAFVVCDNPTKLPSQLRQLLCAYRRHDDIGSCLRKQRQNTRNPLKTWLGRLALNQGLWGSKSDLNAKKRRAKEKQGKSATRRPRKSRKHAGKGGGSQNGR